jgi:hypothetical protein
MFAIICYDITYQSNLTIHFAEKPAAFPSASLLGMMKKIALRGERMDSDINQVIDSFIKGPAVIGRSAFPPNQTGF